VNPAVCSIARADDLAAVLALMRRQFEEHDIEAAPDALERAIAAVLGSHDRGFFVLARAEGEPVGAAYVSFTWALEHCGKSSWLEELYVLPECRGRGLGRELLGAALEEARMRGCAATDLEVEAEHERAENLYRREGFRPLSRSRWVKRLGE
jgi:ribosomal protein S18 acetylase RimI-like enzyme